jgi:hypothetical protein
MATKATKYSKILIQGVAADTGNLLEVRNSAGAAIYTVNVDGLGQTQYAEVTVTNAELKAIRATPKQLVTAPGAGKMLEFVSAQIVASAAANALTESADNLAVRFTDGSGVIVSQAIEATGFLDQTASTISNALPKIDAIVAASGAANKALVLHNTGDGEYGGNAAADLTLKVRTVYRVHLTT